MSELAGKAKRVAGTFVAMMGAGLILETRADWLGAAIFALGVGLFIRGWRQGRLPATVAPAHPVGNIPALPSQATKGDM